MYNRYVPQNDGSFQRNWIPDPPPRPAPSRPAPQHKAPPPPPPPPCEPEPPCQEAPHRESCPPPHHGSIMGFLRQLLPAGFDTGDLIVVLLLLLMAGDKPEDKNTALLTLALYCFL